MRSVGLVVVLLVAGAASATMALTSRASAKPTRARAAAGARGTYVPADILRKVAVGATRLELLVDSGVMEFEREEAAAGGRTPPGGVLASVSDRAAIAELLAAIDTPPVPFGGSGGHGCGGFPIVRLFRGDTLAAEFSFDHVAFLRPRSRNLWRGGDVGVTEASAKAMAAWFKRHGYSGYQDELDSARREQERWDAFYSAFPKQVRKFLKDYRVRYVETSSGLDTIPPADALAAAIPNEHKRAEVICRALGLLDRNWFGATDAESAVLWWAEALSPQTLVRAIDSFADNSPELLGAALVLFGSQPPDGPWLSKLDQATSDRIAARTAALVFSGGNRENTDSLPLRLGALRYPAVERVLQDQAAGLGAARDGPCDHLYHASAPLSALVVLAKWRMANPAYLSMANQKQWECKSNRSAARIARALASEQLPDAADLEDSDLTSALMTLARLRETPTREAIDLAFSSLVNHRWGIARRDTAEWLAALAERKAAKTESENTIVEGLKGWWQSARPTWQPPMSAGGRR